MKKKVSFAVNTIKDHLNREKIVQLMKVEDPDKQHLSCRRARERRAARIETLPSGEQRSNDRRGPDRRQSSANINKYWNAIFVWAGLAFLLTLTMVFGRFSDEFLLIIVGFYTASIIYFVYLSYLFNRMRNRRKTDKHGYFYMVLGGLSLFSFIMCEIGIYLM